MPVCSSAPCIGKLHHLDWCAAIGSGDGALHWAGALPCQRAPPATRRAQRVPARPLPQPAVSAGAEHSRQHNAIRLSLPCLQGRTSMSAKCCEAFSTPLQGQDMHVSERCHCELWSAMPVGP